MGFLFRIENEDGNGPYTGKLDNYGWQLTDHTEEYGRPCPEWDVPGYDRPIMNRHFGFCSLTQLSEWFWHLDELKELRNRGYEVMVYWIRQPITILKHQAIANLTKYCRVIPWDVVLMHWKHTPKLYQE